MARPLVSAFAAVLLWGTLFVASSARATSWPASRLPTLREQAERASRVVIAEVVDRRVVAEEGVPPRLTTVSRLVVRETLKGAGPELLEVTQLGGEKGAWSSNVTGDARLEERETVLVFLHCPVEQPARCVLVGLEQGKLSVRTRADGYLEVRGPEGFGAPRPLERVVDEIRGLRRPEPPVVTVQPPRPVLPAIRVERSSKAMAIPVGQAKGGASR